MINRHIVNHGIALLMEQKLRYDMASFTPMKGERFMQSVTRTLVLVMVLACSGRSLACECRISGSVGKYLKASDVVFIGMVTFTDDDGSGTFVQKTFVHFGVEEAFKGIGAGVHDVWADPGSFTSCYAEYRKGERYLVFAYRGTRMPAGTPAMAAAPANGKRKPLPSEIDPSNPPVIYAAPECTGTLPLIQQTQKLVSAWLPDLRRYKKREDKSTAKHGR